VTVELFGMSRALAGRSSIELDVDGPLDYGAFLRALADAAPSLVPGVISAECDALIEPNLVLLDGRRAVRDGEQISAADRPCILFLASGG
jgi:hypothetical protein